MKVQTINGETLRKEFTAIEAAALKHAAEYCTVGDQFTGVPTCNEERYRVSPESFGVVEHDGHTVAIVRHSTGKTLRAMIVGGSGQTQPAPQPAEEPSDDDNIQVATPGELHGFNDGDEPQTGDTPTQGQEPASENEPQPTPMAQPQSMPQPNPLDPFSMLVEQVKQAVVNQIKPLLDEAVKNQPSNKVERILTVKVNDMVNKVEGLTHPKFERVLRYIANHHNVYLYGPAGSGKNVICEQVAKALGVPFYYQNTIITKFDVTGYKNAAGEFEETEFYKAWTSGGLFMLDEADNACAEALVTLNAALANGYYSFPGIGRVECSKDFYCVAAGNTNGQGATDEYCGRYKMDESSRDRFAFVKIDYNPEIEEGIANGHADVIEFVRELRSICKEQRISLICGYRAIKNLAMFYDEDAADIIDDFILKGAEEDTMREIASRLTGDNKYTEAFKQLAQR